MPMLAGWSPGKIDRPDLWTSDFDALEVVKGNGWDESFALYLDLISRGITPAIIGNTDSHSHRSNNPGFNVTYVHVDVPTLSDVTPEAFARGILDRQTIATNGPVLDVSVLPGTTLSAPTDVVVRALHPSWMPVDELVLFRNDQEVETLPGDAGTFRLDGDEDAAFLIAARSETSMEPVTNIRAFAVTSAYLYDADGDGWTAPLPPLQLGD
jgi:hypothetical protein